MPEITRFGSVNAGDNTCADGVTWFDINIADNADHEWLMAWLLLRRQTYDRYPEQASTGKKKPGRLPDTTTPSAAGIMSARNEDTREQSTQCDHPPDTEDMGHKSGGA